MNILIIGNGFDIAHGLPTTYKDFLECIKKVMQMKTYNKTAADFLLQHCASNDLHPRVKDYINKVLQVDNNSFKKVKDIDFQALNKIIFDMIECSKDNVWIKWFNELETLPKEGWIDFESEISRVIQIFESVVKEVSIKEVNIRDLSKAKEVIKIFAEGKPEDEILKVNDFNNYKNKMLKDLNDLVRCFELYLEDCVRNIDTPILSPDIGELKIEKVLSFNYTDTYDRLYTGENTDIEYDYIHGMSKLEGSTENNMVLGIDEYLQDDERNVNIDYIQFKKYYQRIHKRTGCNYKNWLEEINKSQNEEHHVYIFGHSLAITDKDVLKEILTNIRVKTTIFYYDGKSYGEQIAHLVQVLGQDKLISMVYGNNPIIKFKLQKNMTDRSKTP